MSIITTTPTSTYLRSVRQERGAPSDERKSISTPTPIRHPCCLCGRSVGLRHDHQREEREARGEASSLAVRLRGSEPPNPPPSLTHSSLTDALALTPPPNSTCASVLTSGRVLVLLLLLRIRVVC